jgi:hypothetical protein
MQQTKQHGHDSTKATPTVGLTIPRPAIVLALTRGEVRVDATEVEWHQAVWLAELLDLPERNTTKVCD